MADPRAEVERLLEEKPEFEDHLAAVLEVDGEHDAWTFDDIPLDSGAFGELVSRGVATEAEDGAYELADPDAVAAALAPDSAPTSAAPGDGPEPRAGGSILSAADASLPSTTDLSLPDVDRRTASLLSGLLGLLVAMRLVPYGAVVRDGDVVLSSNDPYYYRALVAETAARAGGPLDIGVLSSVPDPTGEPLLVATLWWVSAMLGGGETVAGYVIAVYPVVTAVASAVALYVLAVRLTADRRVGLATVGLLAVTPVHAVRTGLGFADHHALDYLLLSVTALGLVVATREESPEAAWAGALALGAGVGAQVLAWEAGPLLLVPVAVYVALRVLADVRDGTAPLSVHPPLLAGLGVGAVVALTGHALFGWQTGVVAYSPLLLLLGAVAVVGAAELVHRRDGTAAQLAGVEGAGLVLGVLLGPLLAPGAWGDLTDGVGRILGRRAIVETQSLFAGVIGGLAAPMFQFGFLFVLAVPYMVWTTWRTYRGGDPRWLVPLAYGWLFLALGVVQIRFAAQFALFAAVFGGFAFVHVAAWVDLGTQPASLRDDGTASDDAGDVSEDRRTVIQMAGLSLGIGGLGGILTPVVHGQATIDDADYRAAKFVASYADERDLTYPANYVFSSWSQNRLYNWFVSGRARSYAFARENYGPFLTSKDPAKWYRRLGDRVGFVVLKLDDIPAGQEDSNFIALAEGWGDGTGHYRALWTDDEGFTRVYELVPGAVVAARAPDADDLRVRTPVPVGGVSATYERPATSTPDGWTGTVVPYPGEYEVGDRTLTVTEADVRTGDVAGERSGTAHWRLQEDGGRVLFDAEGGNHARRFGGGWTEGRRGRAFDADGDGYGLVGHDEAIAGADGLTVAAWVRADDDTDFRSDRTAARVAAKDADDGPTEGYRLGLSEGRASAGLGDGDATASLSGPRVDGGDWHHLALAWDGATARLYVDGERVDAVEYDGGVASEWPLGIAASADGASRFVGAVDELRFRDEAVDAATVERWANDDASATPASE